MSNDHWLQFVEMIVVVLATAAIAFKVGWDFGRMRGNLEAHPEAVPTGG